MSYLVLARKYRPRTFAEVAGQQTAMRTLENAIREDRVGHAYLFTGSRGTGKTTTARILAKALLCEKGPTPEPCGECEQCRDVEAGRHVDVTEIDAASNRGIDAVRELRDGVGYAPMRARYRIYIVDEVHQITKEGFNAFLKTLEEPPAHVKFLFATTEVDKVIETVRSRCQIVRLALIAEDVIAATLEEILAKEGVKPGPGVTAELAKLARGSMRDALTLTDQLIALVGAEPAAADVQRVAPHSSEELALELWDAMERGDSASVLTALPRGEGGEVEVCTALLEALRLALVCVLCPTDAALFEADAERRARLVERAKRLGSERTQLWLEELLHSRERMALLPRHARVVLEVTLLDLARPSHTIPLGQLEQRLAALEARLSQGLASRPAAAAAPQVQAAQLGSAPRPAPAGREPHSAPRETPEATLPPTPAPATSLPPASAPAASAVPSVPAATPPARPTAPASNGTHASSSRPGAPGGWRPSARPASKAPTPAPPAHTATWNATLEELGRQHDELAGVLARCGGLSDVGSSRAVVRVTRPTESERNLLAAPATAPAIATALSAALGRTMEVVIDDPAQRPSGQSDDFTRKVAELFTGQIEESDR
jgi:DNA polymerase-3 subunit gamma/tau